MKTGSCPKCGSAEWKRGKLYQLGTLNDVRFKADAAFGLSLKERVVAVACSNAATSSFFSPTMTQKALNPAASGNGAITICAVPDGLERAVPEKL